MPLNSYIILKFIAIITIKLLIKVKLSEKIALLMFLIVLDLRFRVLKYDKYNSYIDIIICSKRKCIYIYRL